MRGKEGEKREWRRRLKRWERGREEEHVCVCGGSSVDYDLNEIIRKHAYASENNMRVELMSRSMQVYV